MCDDADEYDDRPADEILAEMTGRPREDFQYDGEIPDAEDLEWERVDEDADAEDEP